MKRIDAHQHFWKYNPLRDAWLTDFSILQNDFLPAGAAPFLQQHNIDGCIAVQADQSENETDFLLQLAAENTLIKGVVGWINFCADNVEERLSHYAKNKKVKGFRHILQAEPDDEFMLKDKFLNGISLLDKYGFSYDVLVYPRHLRYVQQLVAMFPDQPFVVDHLAKPFIKQQELKIWQEDIQKIALYPNVYCKVSGMVTEADWHQHRYEHFVPYLDTVVQAFGFNRIMFGSDFPVCLLAASYNNMFGIVEKYFLSFSPDKQALFFGGNASRFYRLC